MIRVYQIVDLLMPGQFEGFGHRKVRTPECRALLSTIFAARQFGVWSAPESHAPSP
jgi:hypothetical protein